MHKASKRALVVLSGGQDSTTCLFWAISRFDEVYAITFDYGQRHRIELESASKVAELAKVEHKIVKIDLFSELTSNALTGGMEIQDISTTKLPTTFVPGRNLIFVNIAAVYAYNLEIRNLILGVAQVDYSGYPDCREETMRLLEKSLCAGMDYNFNLITPLINMSKSETIKLAESLGIMGVLAYSHTCYRGEFPPCGKCESCVLRAKGFKEAGITDPLILRSSS